MWLAYGIRDSWLLLTLEFNSLPPTPAPLCVWGGAVGRGGVQPSYSFTVLSVVTESQMVPDISVSFSLHPNQLILQAQTDSHE